MKWRNLLRGNRTRQVSRYLDWITAPPRQASTDPIQLKRPSEQGGRESEVKHGWTDDKTEIVAVYNETTHYRGVNKGL